MRLKKIHTTKLFGLFDHIVPLNMDERITIIHGPNGFGKTAILRLISALFNRQFSVLFELPFESFSLEFDDGKTLTLKQPNTKTASKDARTRRSRLPVVEYDGKSEDLSRLVSADVAEMPPGAIDDYLPFLSRTGPREWFNQHTNEILTLDDIAVQFADHFPHARHQVKEMQSWLGTLIDSFTVHYIRAQRLETIERPRQVRRERILSPTAAVLLYAQELAQKIQQTLGRYAELSTSLDRTFPHRLVAQQSQSQLSLYDLRQKLSTLEDRQNKLADVGLLDAEVYPVPVPNFDDSKIDVLSVYVDDAAKKLDVFDDLYERINLFRALLNKRFEFKSVSINRQTGFEFHTHAREPLAPTGLSTGEQHEVVLLYELLFRVSRNSLILVDEPEISLHIAWQEQFLRDLKDITQLSEFDILIATHSPQIISNRWDLTVELQSPLSKHERVAK
jgi:predicted ATP-binding protein involved in virulence